MKLGAILSGTADRIPEKVAVVCGDRRITFAELDHTSNQIANALLQRDIKVGDRIAVLMPNSIELVQMLSGIVKTGALTVPLSPRLSDREVKFILGHARPNALVFPESLRGSVQQTLSNLTNILGICVGSPQGDEVAMEELISGGDPTPPPSLSPQPDDCVLGYTSGTTGLPKGAIGTHANLLAIGGLICTQEWQLTSDDVIFASTPMSHRTGFSRLINTFQLGCRLVLQPRFDPSDAVEVIAREKVTVVSGVPTIVRMMMDTIEANADAMDSVRLIVTTGEAFPESLQARLAKAVPHVGLYTYLAQTEAGIVTGMRPEDHRLKPGAMGKVLPGIEVRLVDQELVDVPRGEPGEILVRCGEPGRFTVMRAYFDDIQATGDVFVDGWLRTGDIAYEDSDGYLYFADRAKDMIVSGGFNIYSREVERVLTEHDAVAAAAVFGVPDDEFGEAVAACVQCQDGKTVAADDLIEHCRAELASYKKPKHIFFVEDMPRTSAGKVQKHEIKKRYGKSPT